ncbi:hypothetical protein EAH79_12050 [Sphingomonas koreensis]|nr:hypothetical protein EAH79_12050 [Sphingomonas koreensis]
MIFYPSNRTAPPRPRGCSKLRAAPITVVSLIHYLVHERLGASVADETTQLDSHLRGHADSHAVMTFNKDMAIVHPHLARFSVRLDLAQARGLFGSYGSRV